MSNECFLNEPVLQDCNVPKDITFNIALPFLTKSFSCSVRQIMSVSNEIVELVKQPLEDYHMGSALRQEKSYPRVGFLLFSPCMTQVPGVVPRCSRVRFSRRERIDLHRWMGTISREATFFAGGLLA